MKVLFRYTRQPRRYADREGFMLVELEEGDNKDEVIKDFNEKRDIVSSNKFLREVDTYEHNGETYTGNLLLFEAIDAFMD